MVSVIRILMLTLLCSSLAHGAVVYTHNGLDYTLSTVVISWADGEDLIQSQFWWGDEDLTEMVASQTGADLLGDEDFVYYIYDLGVVPGFGLEAPFVRYDRDEMNCCYDDPHLQGGSIILYDDFYLGIERTVAIAELSNVPAPPAIWLFASAVMGLRVWRKR